MTRSSFRFPLLVLWAEDLLMENSFSLLEEPWLCVPLVVISQAALIFPSVRSTPSGVDNEEGVSHSWPLLYFGQ